MKYNKTYTIKADETLQSIAFKLLGDTSYWRTLVSLNNLQYPYIVATNKERLQNPEHLKTIGDTLILPTTNTIETAVEGNLGSYDKQNIYDMVMGEDLAIKFDTDRDLDEAVGEVYATNSGDIATVNGLANLKQSLIMRLLTRKGTLLNHADYGSRLSYYLGQSIDDKTLQLITTEVLRTITTDTRVAKASIPVAKIETDGVFIQAEIEPINFDTALNLFIYRANTGQVSLA